MKVWKFITVSVVFALSLLAWFVTGLTTADAFLPLGMEFAGVGEEIARPIVSRLYVALRIGLTMAPWLLLFGWAGARAVARNSARLDRASFFFGVLALLTLFALPYPIMPAVPGLDNSWQWLLNQLAFTGAIGRDTVFTYGPLGFLLCPESFWANVLSALAANLLHAALWAFALVALYRSGRTAHAAAWLLMATVFYPQSNMEWRWVSLAVVLAAVPAVSPRGRGRSLLLAGAGLVLAVVLFMKFSSLVIVATAQVLFVGLVAMRKKRWLGTICPWMTSFCVTAAVLAALSFDSVASLGNWFIGSLAVASGYNKYMGVRKSWLELAVPFAALSLTAAFLFVGTRQKARAALLGFAFSPVFFCAVKYAIVRQGPSPLFYLLAVFAALVLRVNHLLRLRMIVLFLLLLIVTYAYTLPRAVAGETFCHFAFGINPMGIVRTLSLAKSMRSAASESLTKVAPHRLPEEWRRLVGGEKIAFLPHEYAPAMGEDAYDIALLPSFQLYSAYLPSLDALNAKLFSGDSAPRWIVCNVDPVWSGHFVNYPATWQSVFERYQFESECNGLVLLRRHDNCPSIQPIACRCSIPTGVGYELEVLADKWVDCYQWRDRRVSLQWRQTAVGRFCTFLLRNTLTYMSVRYANGDEETIPIHVENLNYQFSILRIGLTSDDYVAVLGGGNARVPVAVRFHAEAPGFYSTKIRLRVSLPTDATNVGGGGSSVE